MSQSSPFSFLKYLDEMRIPLLASTAVLAVLVLAGCTAPGAETGPESASTRAPLSSPPATVLTPSPMPEPTEDPDSSTRSPDSAIQAVDAYDLCKKQTLDSFASPDDAEWVSFDQSQVWDMQNGYWNATIDLTSTGPGDESISSVTCIVGGTIGAPVWNSYGVSAGSAPGAEVVG